MLTITVDTLIDELDGSIVDGDVSLRDAIALAPSGETIDFDASLDGGTILLTMNELSITRAMTVDTTSLSKGLTIDAAGNDPTPEEDNGDGSRVFNIDDGDDETDSPVSISGLTLTGGDVRGEGGAVRSAESLTLTSSTISGNSAGGLFDGGGGGISSSGDLAVTSSTISGNSARGLSSGGGGIHASGELTVTSSTISGNSASWYVGGIMASDNTSVMIDSCIVADNTSRAGNTDGAADIKVGTGSLTVQYSLIGDNTGTDLVESPLGSPDANGNLIGDPDGMGVIEPLLGALADNGGSTKTHALMAGSPALDAGDPTVSPPPRFRSAWRAVCACFGGADRHGGV